jgi:hypothetical protein
LPADFPKTGGTLGCLTVGAFMDLITPVPHVYR